MTFLYLGIVLCVLYVLLEPFLEKLSPEEIGLFQREEEEMAREDLQFRKDMIRESLEDTHTDLSMKKITSAEHTELLADIYAQADAVKNEERKK